MCVFLAKTKEFDLKEKIKLQSTYADMAANERKDYFRIKQPYNYIALRY